MAVVISGKKLAQGKRLKMKEQVTELEKKYGRRPHLAVILVGQDPASISYVRGKEKACLEVGIINTTICKEETIEQDALLQLIDTLNQDDSVDGILVQLPLPKHIDETKVIHAIRHDKDVDGFHTENVASLFLKQPGMIPCTPKGIMEILKSIPIELQGKKACVVGRSNIVGLPIFKLLLDQNATVTVTHSKTENLASYTKEADILIVAVGKSRLITKDMVKEGAVVIDVGINRDPLTNKLCGDVDFDSVVEKAGYVTKVPGGVGPMTICCLLENTIETYLKHVEE